MKIAITMGVIFLALFTGLVAAMVSWVAVALIVPLLLAIWVLRDYRVGVVFVALLLPFISSRLLPQAGGFNPISYALAAAFAVLVVGRLFKLREMILPPRVLLICLGAPLCVGAMLALPHLVEGQRNFPGEFNVESVYTRFNYIKSFLIRPAMYVVLSVLLANAIHDSKKPERFILVLAIAALIPVAAIIAMVGILGMDLGSLQAHRGFLSGLGMHANEFGKLLAFAFGPLLYVTFATQGFRRLFFGFATLAVLVGILLTFTRAAYIAAAIVMLIFLTQLRQPGLILAMLVAGFLAAMVAPSAFMDRITTGVSEGSAESARAGSLNDKLTAGRIGGYQLLLPEVIHSPIWGRGTGSTAWSSPVTFRRYDSTHPHNLYLEAALDTGLIGLCLALYLYYRLLDGMRRLSKNSALSAEMQAFFGGSATAFIGILVLSMAGGHWYPHPEQALMWVAFGITLAYWPWVEDERRRERAASSRPKVAGVAQGPASISRQR